MSEYSRENINCYHSDRLSYSKVSVLNFEKEFRNNSDWKKFGPTICYIESVRCDR